VRLMKWRRRKNEFSSTLESGTHFVSTSELQYCASEPGAGWIRRETAAGD
jgi:hypothetical protein